MFWLLVWILTYAFVFGKSSDGSKPSRNSANATCRTFQGNAWASSGLHGSVKAFKGGTRTGNTSSPSWGRGSMSVWLGDTKAGGRVGISACGDVCFWKVRVACSWKTTGVQKCWISLGFNLHRTTVSPLISLFPVCFRPVWRSSTKSLVHYTFSWAENQ